jgi:hypothetical protein
VYPWNTPIENIQEKKIRYEPYVTIEGVKDCSSHNHDRGPHIKNNASIALDWNEKNKIEYQSWLSINYKLKIKNWFRKNEGKQTKLDTIWRTLRKEFMPLVSIHINLHDFFSTFHEWLNLFMLYSQKQCIRHWGIWNKNRENNNTLEIHIRIANITSHIISMFSH